jgi:outer membrane lipoprotein-sorting protein
MSGFWTGVDKYECVFDDELQIPVKVTAIVDGVPAATISVERVIVDEPIPASTFDFSPPAGTRIAQVGEKKTH